MRFGSVCSGIEAASVAWASLGWEAAWFAEVDKAASLVLAYRYPNVPNYGDMTKLAAMVLAGEIEAPDVLVGGTPCQDFSIAGLRAGLAGDRGQLTLAFIVLANAIDQVRALKGLPPCIIVWENVPGVLNHESNPLGCFLAGLAGDDEALEPGPRPDGSRSSAYWTWDKAKQRHRPKWPNAGAAFGPQRAVAWRVLDAQYFGLAQRRRRVFAVARAREGFDPAALLFEFDGLRRDTAPRREAGEGVAGTAASCAASGGLATGQQTEGRSASQAFGGGKHCNSTDVSTAVTAHAGGRFDLDTETFVVEGFGGVAPRVGFSPEVSPTLRAGGNQTGGDRPPGTDVDTVDSLIVVEPLPFDTTQITHPSNGSSPKHGDPCHPLAAAGHAPCIAFSSKDWGADASDDLSPTLRARRHAESHANAGIPPAIAFYPTNREPENGNCVDFSPTLTAGNGPVPGIAYSVALRGRDGGATAELGDNLAGCLRASGGGGDKPYVLAPVCVTGDITHTLKADGFDASEDGTGRGQPIVPASLYSIMPMNSGRDFKACEMDVAQPLMAGGPVGGNQGGDYVLETQAMEVRLLMLVECERLQGFPDGHTRVPVRHYKARRITKNRPVDLWEPAPQGGWWLMAADGPRYKQCGNSMATLVMKWIGTRIVEHLEAANDPAMELLGHNGGPPLDPIAAVLG